MEMSELLSCENLEAIPPYLSADIAVAAAPAAPVPANARVAAAVRGRPTAAAAPPVNTPATMDVIVPPTATPTEPTSARPEPIPPPIWVLFLRLLALYVLEEHASTNDAHKPLAKLHLS